MKRIILTLLSFLYLISGEIILAQSHPQMNLVPNGDFEQDTNGDSIPDYWQIKPSTQEGILSGRERVDFQGGYSLALPGKSDVNWTCQIKDLKPYSPYLLSFWVKREGWREGEYPQITIFNQTRELKELFSWGGWVRYSWFVNSGPQEETVLSLSNYAMSHKVWFDSVCLEEFQVKLTFPSPNQVLTAERLIFTWEMPRTDQILNIELQFSQAKDFESKKVFYTVSPLGNTFILYPKLSPGKWYWRLRVYKNRQLIVSSHTSSFKYLGTKSTHFPKRQPATKTDPPYIMGADYNKTPVKPLPASFFPLGIYGADLEVLPELKAAGFNSVQSYNSQPQFIKKFVLAAAREGLKALVKVPNGLDTISLFTFLKELSASPGLLAWYLADEPEGQNISPSYLWQWSNYLHGIAPKVPTSLVVLRPWKTWDYSPAVDILMVDPYPIPRIPITWLSDCLDEARRAVFNEKPVWAVIQAFDWSAFPVGEEKREWGRTPTYEEERCLSYLALVHGAKGLFYFTFKGGNYYIKDYPQHWEEVKKVVRELNQIYPLLLAPQSFPVSTHKSIHYIIRKVDKRLISRYKGIIKEGSYLMAVNVAHKPVKAIFPLPSSFNGKARVLFEDQTIPIEGGKIKDHFGPYEVRVYYIQ
jgi:hypothetical protein